MVACFLQTASSYVFVSSRSSRTRWCTYSRHSQEHDDELLLAQDRVSDKRICKPGQASPALFKERSVSS